MMDDTKHIDMTILNDPYQSAESSSEDMRGRLEAERLEHEKDFGMEWGRTNGDHLMILTGAYSRKLFREEITLLSSTEKRHR